MFWVLRCGFVLLALSLRDELPLQGLKLLLLKTRDVFITSLDMRPVRKNGEKVLISKLNIVFPLLLMNLLRALNDRFIVCQQLFK